MVSVPVEKLCKKLGIPEVVCEDPPPDAKGLLWPVEKYIEYYPEACWEAILVLMCQVSVGGVGGVGGGGGGGGACQVSTMRRTPGLL